MVETTTRARSFLFISAALTLAAASGDHVPLVVPENGYIALNVPLTKARVGSLSTRTTHPHYLALLETALHASGIANPIQNPYEFCTKGEMLQQSANQDLLRRLAPMSVSCSHPEVGRWGNRQQGNCGYCFPCIIRQSSMHAAGFKRDEYAWDILTGPSIHEEHGRGADLRAVLNAVFSNRPDRDVVRNGPLPSTRQRYIDVWRRGNQEIRRWLEDEAQDGLRNAIEAIPS
ncbi:hypothetical protein [Mycetocola sp.]|uniref:hypothetical protein n=1 Tax=Mycetocola sp. TaxID=1871042 RepID=UPI003989DD27